MEKITFTFHAKPIPLNAIYATDFRTRRRFKSKKYNEFSSIIEPQLKLQEVHVEAIQKYFDENSHFIICHYRFYLPIFTKPKNKKEKPRISKNVGDVTNFFKACEDLLFNHLGINDAFCNNVSGDRIHSLSPRIEIDVYIKDISAIM